MLAIEIYLIELWEFENLYFVLDLLFVYLFRVCFGFG